MLRRDMITGKRFFAKTFHYSNSCQEL